MGQTNGKWIYEYRRTQARRSQNLVSGQALWLGLGPALLLAGLGVFPHLAGGPDRGRGLFHQPE